VLMKLHDVSLFVLNTLNMESRDTGYVIGNTFTKPPLQQQLWHVGYYSNQLLFNTDI